MGNVTDENKNEVELFVQINNIFQHFCNFTIQVCNLLIFFIVYLIRFGHYHILFVVA